MKIVEITGFKHRKNFNPSFDGKRFAYRIEDEEAGIVSAIGLGRLNYTKVADVDVIPFEPPVPGSNLFEDPRLFTHNDQLWVSFIVASYINGTHWAAQGVALIDGYKPKKVFYPKWGQNNNHISVGNGLMTREKNWTFFSHQGKIHVLYSVNPLRVGIMDEETGEITDVRHTMFNAEWPHGNIHGSAGLIPWNSDLLGVFHSNTRDIDGQRKYYVGFYVVNPSNWTVTHFSKEPFMSAERDNKKDLRPFSQPYRPNVIFPCGLTEEKGEIIMSYGWQDCRCMMAYISKDEIRANLKPTQGHLESRMMIRDTSMGIPGGYKCEIRGIPLWGANWNHLRSEARNRRIEEVELHDAITPRLPNHLKETKWHPIKTS